VLPRILALGLFLLASASCSSGGSSSDCKDICQKEASCVDKMSEEGKEEDEEQNKFDQSECIAACEALNRDEVGKKLVEKHKACADAAKGAKDYCAALLQCK
jgi:hypothetical protein